MKIYTKTGDDGTTALFSGGRVHKTHMRVEAYGTVDELNSLLGVARSSQPTPKTDSMLEEVQNRLFYLGADLATPQDAQSAYVVRLEASAVEWLEQGIDKMMETLPALNHFILPGGTLCAAHLQVARAVCRRAERLVVHLMTQEEIGDVPLHYLNRLSDWLFTLARWENHQHQISESAWRVR
jgi:cob(I)alamin adenosyltransferase